MYRGVPEYGLAGSGHHRARSKHDGREARTAKSVSFRLKALFAVIALVINGGLAMLAWNAGVVWLAVTLTAIVVFLVLDLVWLRYKQIRHVGNHEA